MYKNLILGLCVFFMMGCNSDKNTQTQNSDPAQLAKATNWESSEILRFFTSNYADAQRFEGTYPEYSPAFEDIEPGKILHSFDTTIWVTQFKWIGDTSCGEGDSRLIVVSSAASTCTGIGNEGEETYQSLCGDGLTSRPSEIDPCE